MILERFEWCIFLACGVDFESWKSCQEALDVIPVAPVAYVFLNFESILDNLSITGAFFSALVAKNKSDLGMSLQKLPQEVKDLKLFFQKYDLNRNGRPLRQTAKDEVDSQGALVFNRGAHVAQPCVVVSKMCFVQYCSVISAIRWFIFPSQMRWMRTQLTNDHYDVASTFKTLPVESRSCLGEEKEATLFTVWDAAFGYLCGTCGPAFFTGFMQLRSQNGGPLQRINPISSSSIWMNCEPFR